MLEKHVQKCLVHACINSIPRGTHVPEHMHSINTSECNIIVVLLEWILFLLLIKSWICSKSNLKIMAVLLLSNFISNTVNYLVKVRSFHL